MILKHELLNLFRGATFGGDGDHLWLHCACRKWDTPIREDVADVIDSYLTHLNGAHGGVPPR